VKNREPNILVIKLSAVGDVVHSLPFLEVLRDRFPSAMIDWVVEEDASGIVEGHPDIDRLMIFPRKSSGTFQEWNIDLPCQWEKEDCPQWRKGG